MITGSFFSSLVFLRLFVFHPQIFRLFFFSTFFLEESTEYFFCHITETISVSSLEVVPCVFQKSTGKKRQVCSSHKEKNNFFLFLSPLFPLLCLPFSHLLNEMFPQFHSTQDGSGRAWQLWEQMTYNQRTA